VKDDPTLLEDLLAIAHSIPQAARRRIPTDASARFDEYVEGKNAR